MFDGDKIKKVTLSLEEYQNELKETVTQVRMLSGAEKENLSSSNVTDANPSLNNNSIIGS